MSKTNRPKLTLVQCKFLEKLSLSGSQYAVETWPPVRNLEKHGLVESHKGSWRITTAGSLWLQEAKQSTWYEPRRTPP